MTSGQRKAAAVQRRGHEVVSRRKIGVASRVIVRAFLARRSAIENSGPSSGISASVLRRLDQRVRQLEGVSRRLAALKFMQSSNS